MLIFYDKNHNKIAGLTNYREYNVEREFNSEDTLSFQYPSNDVYQDLIQEECYIRTRENEYIVKEVNYNDDDWVDYVCKINIENIKGQNVDHFEIKTESCFDAVNLGLAGTGWTVGSCDVSKIRPVSKSTCTAYDVLQEIQSSYDCEMSYDSINKKVYVYNEMGEDKGAYFAEQLNLKKLEVQGNSYDYVTKLVPIGKDGLDITTVNNGINYIENHQYSNKSLIGYWEDNRYTDPTALMEDAIIQLNYQSKPLKSYKVDLVDLAKAIDSENYAVYNLIDYSLGDTVTILSREKNIKEKQRIAKMTIYPEEPERNEIELSNKSPSLEYLQIKFQDTSDVVDAVTTSDGTIDGSKVDNIDWDNIQNVHVEIADVKSLNATIANIGKLNATEGDITILNAVNGNIINLLAKKASIEDLSATYATIENLNATNLTAKTFSAKVGNVINLVTGTLQAGIIVANSAVIADAAISTEQIIDLDVKQLRTGIISTNKFDVQSDSGNLLIKENTLKIWDTTGNERVSLGLNGTDYNLLVRGSDGNTVLFGTTGVTKAGITQGSVDDSKIDVNANINGSKLNIDSVFSSMNGSTSTLSTSKVKFDDTGQTLDVSFTKLSKTVTDTFNTVSGQITSISAMQGEIDLKVSSTDISTYQNQIISFRYIRDWVNGSTLNKADVFLEIEAMQGTTNVAFGKTVTADFASNWGSGLANVTDGKIIVTNDGNSTLANYMAITSGGLHSVTVDLGSIYSNIDYLQIYHFPADSRTFHNTKTEVSTDGVNWVTLFDSSKTGEYAETSNGHVINVNINNVVNRIATSESSITALQGSITSKVSQTDVTTAISNIQVGGRNLLNNGDFHDVGLPQWTGFNCTYSVSIDAAFGNVLKVVSTGNGVYNVSPKSKCIIGQTYTWSAWIKSDTISSLAMSSEQTTNTTVTCALTTNWQKFSGTGIATGTGGALTFYCSSGITFYLANVKYEIGNKATDWTSAPEDTQAQISGLTFTKSTGITISNNNLSKPSGPADWNTGISSIETLSNGQYVECTIGANTVGNISCFMLGLSKTYTYVNSKYTNINFALYVNDSPRQICIWENGVSITNIAGTWATGDTVRIAIENGIVNYYHNGLLIYTSLKVPTLPLVLDSTICNLGSVMQNVVKGSMLSGLSTSISSLTTRISSAEQKILPDSIISTVSQSIASQSSTNFPVANSDAGITYGGGTWSVETINGAYNGKGVYCNTTNAYVQYTFVGTGINIYCDSGVNMGIMQPYVDGVVSGSPVDCYNATTVIKYYMFTINKLSYGKHTVKIVVTGTKNTSAANCFFEFDYLEVLNTSATVTISSLSSQFIQTAEGFVMDGNKIKIDADNVDLSANKSISSKVSTDGVISAINQTAGDITINAKKLNLEGYATFKSLSTEGETTINGANITTGTLIAEKIFGETITGCKLQTSSAGEYALVQDNSFGIWRDFSGGSIDPTWGLVLNSETTTSTLDLKAMEPTGTYLTELGIGNNSGTTYITASPHVTSFTITAPVVNIVSNENNVLSVPLVIDPLNGIVWGGVNKTMSFEIGTGDGASWSTYNAKISSWDGLAFGSNANYDGTLNFKPKILFDCRNGNIDTWGHLNVAGGKNRVVRTVHYGTRALGAYETAEPCFGDIGRNKLMNGQRTINIDNIFIETVNTNIQYEVKTWAYGCGNVWVETEEMYPNYFIVHGSADIEFGYEIIAKQLGYESDRLEIVNM